jgi:peptidoglycan/LPS O-acetylase OafA/YrhL
MKTPEARKTTFYLPELDLLRFGAFLLVFAFHIMPGLSLRFTATVGIAWLSYRYFESPFLRLKTRYSLVDRGRV